MEKYKKKNRAIRISRRHNPAAHNAAANYNHLRQPKRQRRVATYLGGLSIFRNHVFNLWASVQTKANMDRADNLGNYAVNHSCRYFAVPIVLYMPTTLSGNSLTAYIYLAKSKTVIFVRSSSWAGLTFGNQIQYLYT